MIVMFMKSSTSIAGGEGGGGQKEYMVNLMAMKPSTDFVKCRNPVSGNQAIESRANMDT